MNGIWVLNVDKADEESTLKTENAYRVVPIHQALLDHGFLEFVEQGKQVTILTINVLWVLERLRRSPSFVDKFRHHRSS